MDKLPCADGLAWMLNCELDGYTATDLKRLLTQMRDVPQLSRLQITVFASDSFWFELLPILAARLTNLQTLTRSDYPHLSAPPLTELLNRNRQLTALKLDVGRDDDDARQLRCLLN